MRFNKFQQKIETRRLHVLVLSIYNMVPYKKYAEFDDQCYNYSLVQTEILLRVQLYAKYY